MDRKVTVAAGCVILGAACANALLLKRIAAPDGGIRQVREAAIVADYDRERFARLKELLSREALPEDRTVGYIDDEPPGSAQATGKYQATRYALVPVVVARGPDRPLVVGNLGAPSRRTKAAVPAGLVLVRDFGNGVKLFRARGR
jgi:hypothetical protein